MTKTFKTNKNGKIEFTRKELEKLLDEVWRDGYNSNNTYTWSSPWWSSPITWTYLGDNTTATSTITNASSTNLATISSDNISNGTITVKIGE